MNCLHICTEGLGTCVYGHWLTLFALLEIVHFLLKALRQSLKTKLNEMAAAISPTRLAMSLCHKRLKTAVGLYTQFGLNTSVCPTISYSNEAKLMLQKICFACILYLFLLLLGIKFIIVKRKNYSCFLTRSYVRQLKIVVQLAKVF